MPYRRYTGRKRKRLYRPGYDRQVGFYGRNIKRRKYAMRTHNGGEKKFYDMELDDASLASTGNFLGKTSIGPNTNSGTIVDLVQGTSESQRIGRKCTITKIHARMNFEFLPGSNPNLGMSDNAHETIRFILYWDKQCNGAAASFTDLIETDVYNSYRNLANVKRFVILYDKIWAWNSTAVGAADAVDQQVGTAINQVSNRVIADYQINFSINVFIPIEFANTDGALTGIRSNNIGIMVWAKHGSRMKVSPSKMRLRFIDF